MSARLPWSRNNKSAANRTTEAEAEAEATLAQLAADAAALATQQVQEGLGRMRLCAEALRRRISDLHVEAEPEDAATLTWWYQVSPARGQESS